MIGDRRLATSRQGQRLKIVDRSWQKVQEDRLPINLSVASIPAVLQAQERPVGFHGRRAITGFRSANAVNSAQQRRSQVVRSAFPREMTRRHCCFHDHWYGQSLTSITNVTGGEDGNFNEAPTRLESGSSSRTHFKFPGAPGNARGLVGDTLTRSVSRTPETILDGRTKDVRSSSGHESKTAPQVQF